MQFSTHLLLIFYIVGSVRISCNLRIGFFANCVNFYEKSERWKKGTSDSVIDKELAKQGNMNM